VTPTLVGRLTLALAVVYAVLGVLEVVLKAADDSSVPTIAFFGGTLLGGAALLAAGLAAPAAGTARRVLVVLGAGVGVLASAWTLVVPVLAAVVMVGTVQLDREDATTPPP
jgi:hypothetical protein